MESSSQLLIAFTLVANKGRVYFSIREKEKRVVMFRYLLDTQRERVLERDKGGGKRLVSRKAVANAIVPKPSGLGSWRVLESFAVYKDSSIKNIKFETAQKKIKKVLKNA